MCGYYREEEEKTTTEKYDLIKAENDAMEKELLRHEELKRKSILGGKAEAGIVKPEEKVPELTDEEYTNKFLKGEVNPLGEDGISIN